MIQAVNSTNFNCCGKRKQSFGQQNSEEMAVLRPKRPSKAKALTKYLGTQFVAGAVVSAVFDGLTNGYRAIAKNKPLMNLKEFGTRAAFTGAAFAIIGAVFTGIFALTNRNKK